MTTKNVFYLKIQHFEQHFDKCSFELSWGKGQQRAVTVDYPKNLAKLYTQWQNAYLAFYRAQPQQIPRVKIVESGSFSLPRDYHAELVRAEAELLSEFAQWLRGAELYDIRQEIATASKKSENFYVDIFLTCSSPELAKFPWEYWQIGSDFGVESRKIRIVRTAITRAQSITNISCQHTRKARILVILGDEPGLDFASEKRAIDSLKSMLDVTFINHRSNESIAEFKNRIVNAIAQKSGWDILFFLGHSNETELTGGELGIAPNVALSINEIEKPLTTAKNRGLKFAIFNSCNGLSIANKLIEFGLSQVAVMRTPIPDQVAGKFLLQFLQALSQYKDVHESLILASEYLLENKHSYPSSYLIPSLFCYPEADLFRIQPFGIQTIIKNFIPSWKEAIALSALLVISLQLGVQGFLLQRRLLVQAIYRQITGQVATVASPPVLLVQIDEDSIKKARISRPNPMDRKYIAGLIDRLVDNRARIIGIDYLLDRDQGKNDSLLHASIQHAVRLSPNPTWFIFAETRDEKGDRLQTSPNIANPYWSLSGEIDNYPWYISLLPHDDFSSQPWYFAGLLTLGYQLQQIPNSPQPKLNSQRDFFSQISDFVKVNHKKNQTILKSKRAHIQIITALSYWLRQMWMHPIIDFSIPPNQVYHTLPGWRLLDNQVSAQNLQNQVVIIAAGGYDEAGISQDQDSKDNFQGSDFPPAIQYWRERENSLNQNKVFTGAEYHAYIVHHLLTQRLVVPIPDLWMIGVAIIIGKSLYLVQLRQPSHSRKYLIITITTSIITAFCGLISLQMYISPTAILLPWFLPSITLWFYLILAIWDEKSDT